MTQILHFQGWHRPTPDGLDPADVQCSPDDYDHPRLRAHTEPDCLKIYSRKIGKAYLVERSKN